MAQSLSKIIVHAIFSTKDRAPFLCDRELRGKLHHYLGGIRAETRSAKIPFFARGLRAD
jgi:hypothetical protein